MAIGFSGIILVISGRSKTPSFVATGFVGNGCIGGGGGGALVGGGGGGGGTPIGNTCTGKADCMADKAEGGNGPVT